MSRARPGSRPGASTTGSGAGGSQQARILAVDARTTTWIKLHGHCGQVGSGRATIEVEVDSLACRDSATGYPLERIGADFAELDVNNLISGRATDACARTATDAAGRRDNFTGEVHGAVGCDGDEHWGCVRRHLDSIHSAIDRRDESKLHLFRIERDVHGQARTGGKAHHAQPRHVDVPVAKNACWPRR